MHSVVVAVGPLARRHAFGEADEVLYSGQLQPQKYKMHTAHAVYIRDKSEMHVMGKMVPQVEERAAQLRLKLGADVEYIAGVVYIEGLSKKKSTAVVPKQEGWQ